MTFLSFSCQGSSLTQFLRSQTIQNNSENFSAGTYRSLISTLPKCQKTQEVLNSPDVEIKFLVKSRVQFFHVSLNLKLSKCRKVFDWKSLTIFFASECWKTANSKKMLLVWINLDFRIFFVSITTGLISSIKFSIDFLKQIKFWATLLDLTHDTHTSLRVAKICEKLFYLHSGQSVGRLNVSTLGFLHNTWVCFHSY